MLRLAFYLLEISERIRNVNNLQYFVEIIERTLSTLRSRSPGLILAVE